MSTDTASTTTVSADHRRDSRYLIGAGILIALLGVAALVAPFLTGIGVSITVGVLLVIGVKLRPDEQWGWFVASGLVSVLLAGLLWAGFPGNAAWAIGVLVAVHFLTTGLTFVAVGYLDRGGPTMGGEEAPETSSGGN